MAEHLEEVKAMREVPRVPEHCGKPMRKLINPSSGAFVFSCGCGHHEPGGNVKDAS